MMTNEEYVKAGGCKCPNCGSKDIEATKGADFDCDWCALPVGCNKCQAQWTELYTLSGYDNLDVPEQIEQS